MSEAVIRWIAGPVLRARTSGPFHIHEALEVGEQRMLGEVIQLVDDELVAQVYEDTTGLRPGDPVLGHGTPLAVELGPGLLGGIYDGLLRPLTAVAGHFITPGSLSRARESRRFPFTPSVSEGQEVKPGDPLGETDGGERILVPPHAGGRIIAVADAGEYGWSDAVCRVKHGHDEARELRLAHTWPVRRPRPVGERLPAGPPMLTGQRIIDTLFPVARGGRAAIPGGFGTGKTILLEAIAKWCDADVIVYVGCGERGNEMAEVLTGFPGLEDPRSGRALMERTVIIANTSNMPVAAREASIYTGITVAEYFRDQGLHVALMADSTSRWAEALREVSGRLGELPGEAGFPAYLSSRLGEFYERCSRARTLSGSEGSVTAIAAVSPPAGDFTEPVTLHTKRYVRCFWGLDKERAQARFYPAIHPLQSYSEDALAIEAWWEARGYTDWNRHRRVLLTVLEDQARLERMARIVGKDALPQDQQLTLLCADLIGDGFLRQSAFSEVDRFCSADRQAAFLRLLIRFVELARDALRTHHVAVAKIAGLDSLRKLQRLGEEFGERDLGKLDALRSAVEAELEAVKRDAG